MFGVKKFRLEVWFLNFFNSLVLEEKIYAIDLNVVNQLKRIKLD